MKDKNKVNQAHLEKVPSDSFNGSLTAIPKEKRASSLSNEFDEVETPINEDMNEEAAREAGYLNEEGYDRRH